MTNARKKPAFKRWMSQSYARLSENWRRPRGRNNKIQRHEKGKIAMPSIGWRAPKDTRGLHPNGFREVVICSLNDLNNFDVKMNAAKISKTVGKKKKIEILKKAAEMKIKVLNPGIVGVNENA